MADAPARLVAALADRYHLERQLGEGGMATVYLAEDLKHRRQVAIKVLKPELAAVLGADRFVQEITTTASLSHPHILPLFDSGEANGFLFYVMPFVDGETLRAKLDRETQLGVDEAVKITVEVADALHYAHEHGVVHRDIKPENILLQNGRPVIADFGIALAVSAAAGGRMTETGLSLGTPHYMSPEQATAEKEITARSDVYSLGSVLYEMLTGNPPHVGSSAQQIIMKIITETPQDVTVLRRAVPPNVAAAVARSLEKLPADRFTSANAFASALGDTGFRDGSAGATASVSTSQSAFRSRAVLVTAALAVAAGSFLVGRGSAPELPTVVDIGLPDTAQLAFMDDTPWGTENPSLVVSPDGDFVVYVARRGPQTELWYRSLVDAEARPLPGTLGASQPALAPDKRTVAFLAGRLLRKVDVDGITPAADVAEVVSPTGMLWTGTDEVLVAIDFGARSEWVRMSDGAKSRAGGPCGWPIAVPGTDDLICGIAGGTVNSSRVVQLNEDGTLPASPTAGRILGDSARPLETGAPAFVDRHLVFVDQEGNLNAAPYDRATGTVGSRTIVRRGLRRSVFGPMGHFGVTRAGDLVYVPGSVGGIGQFVAVQPGGATRVLPIPAKEHLNFSVAPDRRRLAVTSRGVGGQELWIYDMASGQGDRVVSGFSVGYVAWAPDGTLAYSFERAARAAGQTMLLPPDGGRPVALSGVALEPSDFPDRRFLVGAIDLDIAVAELDGTRVVRVDTLKLPNAQYYPVVSPDGRWIAYAGAENGIAQLFVTPFPAMSRQYKLSVDAASEPVWLPDGSLVHRIGSCWYRLAARPGTTPPLEAPALSFCDEKLLNTAGLSNVAMPDGSVLYLRTVAPTTAGFIRVVRGWQQTLEGASSAAGAAR